jgi:catechol 2,3-dioxygenase-like lactoylglutathione lyase family enzyme
MISAIRHTGLVVANLSDALKFWCDVLGFKISKQMDEFGPHIDAMMGLSGVRVTTVKLVAPDNNLIELLYFQSHPDKPNWGGHPFSTGFTHIALTVENLDETCAELSAVGVTFAAAPQYSPDGYAKVTYARGPEGVLLELVEILGK